MIYTKVVKRGAVPGSEKMPSGTWNLRVLRPSFFEVGVFYHIRSGIRQKHFTKEGAREYGYLKRDGEESGGNFGRRMLRNGAFVRRSFWETYTGQKQLLFGHTLPLVYSGRTRQLSAQATIAATRSGVRVRYPGARGLNRASGGWLVKEFTATSPADNARLTEHLDFQVQKHLDRLK